MRPPIKKTKHEPIQPLRATKPAHAKSSSSPLADITSDFGSNQTRGYSTIIWFLLLAWVARITVFIRPRAKDEFTSVDVLAGIQISFVIAILVIVFMSGRAFPIWQKISGTSLRLFYFYYFLCAFSMVWSPLPVYSLYRAGEVITLFSGIVVALSYSRNILKAEQAVFIVGFITMFFTLYINLNLYNFSISIQNLHSTSYPAMAAMIFTYCLGEYFTSDKARKKSMRRVGILALLGLLAGTSTGSFVATVTGVMLIAFFKRNVALIASGGALLLLVFIFTYVFPLDFSFLKEAALHGKTEKNILHLSGRLPMWLMLFEDIMESPIFGHGFALLSSSMGQAFTINPHNSLLSILLGTGFIGFFIIIFYFLRLLREAIITIGQKLPGALGCSAAIFTGIINSFTAPAIFDIWKPPAIVFIGFNAIFILFVLLPYRRQRRAQKIQAARKIF